MSTLFIVFLSISSLCFVGGVLGYGGIPCLLIGSFSCAYLLACLHELAHALACKLTGAKVVKIALLFFKIENGKLFLLRKVYYKRGNRFMKKQCLMQFFCGLSADNRVRREKSNE